MSTTYEEPSNGPALKTKAITMHITEEFYNECMRRAGRTAVGEWARLELEAHLARKPFEMRMIEEFWALRYITVNALPDPSGMKTFIKEADQLKSEKARAIMDGGAR